MIADHYLTWALVPGAAGDGAQVRGDLTCRAARWAPCRNQCTNGDCQPAVRDGRAIESDVCGHEMLDDDVCWAVADLNESGAGLEDAYGGTEPVELRRGRVSVVQTEQGWAWVYGDGR